MRTILDQLKSVSVDMELPAVMQIKNEYGNDPFLVLISCLLSLRTKDSISLLISRELFSRATNAYELVKVSQKELQKIIYPTGFFRQKSKTLYLVSRDLLDKFSGTVPRTEFELLSLYGVGRKTANLVLGQAFGVPAICVDTHVHRICNRIGLIYTKTPEKTEYELQKILPKSQWIEVNHLLVMFGQNICLPLFPRCSKCVLNKRCLKLGVKKHK